MNLKVAYALFKEACSAWADDNASSQAAALAFYTIFSLAPVLVVAVAGLAFGQEAAESNFLRQLHALVGETGAKAIQAMIQSANWPALGVIASLIGIGTVMAGASGAFVELQDALTKIRKVPRRSGSVWLGVIRRALFIVRPGLGHGLPGYSWSVPRCPRWEVTWDFCFPGPFSWKSVNVLFSFYTITLLLGMIFRYLPGTEVAWRTCGSVRQLRRCA